MRSQSHFLFSLRSIPRIKILQTLIINLIISKFSPLSVALKTNLTNMLHHS